MRDYAAETEKRVSFIRSVVADAGAEGVVFANSGGKDCALVGILCKIACDNTTGIIMPCESRRNYGSDRDDARALAEKYGIKTLTVDLTDVKSAMVFAIGGERVTKQASANINPRLRMTALYTLAQSMNCLAAGTGNRSEAYVGYFTKWGDGAYDFNPIADLTATEVFEFLRHLGAPASIIDKAPSAGLYDGQTDEDDFGFTYEQLDSYLQSGKTEPEAAAKIERMHAVSAHKRREPAKYGLRPSKGEPCSP